MNAYRGSAAYSPHLRVPTTVSRGSAADRLFAILASSAIVMAAVAIGAAVAVPAEPTNSLPSQVTVVSAPAP